jgi:hypothetical protein
MTVMFTAKGYRIFRQKVGSSDKQQKSERKTPVKFRGPDLPTECRIFRQTPEHPTQRETKTEPAGTSGRIFRPRVGTSTQDTLELEKRLSHVSSDQGRIFRPGKSQGRAPRNSWSDLPAKDPATQKRSL